MRVIFTPERIQGLKHNSGLFEFVKSYLHLGHIINARMDDTEDISHRRAFLLAK